MAASATCPSFGPAWVSIIVPEWVPVQVEQVRKMFLYLPAGARKAPLWFAFHGTGQHADAFVSWTGLGNFAAENGIALVALQGLKSSYNNLKRFNVGADGERISPDGPKDVEVVKLALQAILQLYRQRQSVQVTPMAESFVVVWRLRCQSTSQHLPLSVAFGINNCDQSCPYLGFPW